jgi:hypothetical protein
MIERRALRRSWLAAHGAATLPRLTRWQRWADALRARWGRALEVPKASGMSFRRMRSGAPLLAVQQRFESVLMARPTYRFDLRRSAVVRNESWLVQPRQTFVRLLMRATPAAREASPSLPTRRAESAKIALTERLVSRISSVLLERRLLSRAVAHADGARAPVMVERIRPPRPALRKAAAVDDIPQRLLRRAERQVAAAAPLPPVRSVLARPAPSRAVERAPDGLAPPRPRGIAAREAAPHAPSAPPVLNLDRITEQVLDRLDRRIIAQRERMGRV